jgi:hypothetical protein
VVELDKLKEFMDVRMKSFEESSKAWSDLKKYIIPLLPESEKGLVSKIDSHFIMLPLEDMIFITIMSAPILTMPKMFCLKCRKEVGVNE